MSEEKIKELELKFNNMIMEFSAIQRALENKIARLDREIDHLTLKFKNRLLKLEDFERNAQYTFNQLADAIKHNAKVVTDMRDSAITIMPQAILRN